MKRSLLIIGICCLSGCGDWDVPSPTRCREVNVDVRMGDEVTGTIRAEHLVMAEEVSKQCKPLENDRGCAKRVGEHDWILWYIDDPDARDEERCHAYYEQRNHIRE